MRFFNSMIDQCDHLTYLIGNILDFSRIESEMKKFHFESLNLVDLIENIVNIYRNRLSESGLTVIFTKENEIPEIMADKDAIRQVVSNLLDNACKYAAAGKRIEVNLTTDSLEVWLLFRYRIFSLSTSPPAPIAVNLRNWSLMLCE